MAEARSSKAMKEERKEQKEKKPNPPPSISIPNRSSTESLFKDDTNPCSTASETLTLTLTEKDSDCRSFSQLLAGAMASPVAAVPAVGNSATAAAVLEIKPMLVVTLAADPVARFPLVGQPAFIGLLAQGQFGMSHQEALASVTAQAQMQLQTGYPSSSLEIPINSPTQRILSALSPTPQQQRMQSVSEGTVSMTELGQHRSLDQPQPHGIVITPSSDGYNWRKYGQKQVKSNESSRSYYRCTHANCVAKKKMERCHDGHITEIIYKGQHSHEPPQKTRCKKESETLPGGLSGVVETGDNPGESLSESSPTSRREQTSSHATPEPQLQCSNNGDGDAGTKADEERGHEPDPKRRLKENTVSYSAPLLKTVKETKVVIQTGSDLGSLGDGYRWRKYGQKMVKGNSNPRSYYRCTNEGCPVRKHVEKASDNEKSLIITYEGNHNHDRPASKSSYDPPSSAALVALAPASGTTDGQVMTFRLLPDEPPSTQSTSDAEGKLSGEKTLEFGGKKTLESAQTLLSIGFNSNSSEEDAEAKNPKVIKPPLLNESSAAVSV